MFFISKLRQFKVSSKGTNSSLHRVCRSREGTLFKREEKGRKQGMEEKVREKKTMRSRKVGGAELEAGS